MRPHEEKAERMMQPWFTSGHLDTCDLRVPVSVVARDDEFGLIVYEQLPISLSVEEGLRGVRSRYTTGRLQDFQPWESSSGTNPCIKLGDAREGDNHVQRD
jgi:hypothetical protein